MTYRKPIISRDLTPVQHKFMYRFYRELKAYKLAKQTRDIEKEKSMPKCSFRDDGECSEINSYMELA